MLGKLRNTVTLDYTHIAEPLDVDDIHRDLTQVFMLDREPDAIELWEHQRDWLAKPYMVRTCRCSYELLSVCGDPVQPGEDTLFGVPIKLREA